MLDVLQRLRNEGMTVVIIEHTMHAMMRIADRFVVLDHGRVLASGLPREVVEDRSVIEAYLGKKWAAGSMLEVSNLSVAYGGLRALTDVSLSVNEGQFVTVVGPNGAGKSTLFKTISGIVPPPAGQITFMGKNLFALPAASARPSGHRPRARGPAGVQDPDRAGKPGNGRLPESRAGGSGTTRWTASTRCSRSWPNAPPSSPARCRAASSRWWPSAAAWPAPRAC